MLTEIGLIGLNRRLMSRNRLFRAFWGPDWGFGVGGLKRPLRVNCGRGGGMSGSGGGFFLGKRRELVEKNENFGKIRKIVEMVDSGDMRLEGGDEVFGLVKGVAVGGIRLSKKSRSAFFEGLRRNGFFETCGVDEFRIVVFEGFRDSFGTAKQQEVVFGAFYRILTSVETHPLLKSELCFEMLEKYLRVYKTTNNLKLGLDLFQAPLFFLYSVYEGGMGLRSLVRLSYSISLFGIELEDEEVQEARSDALSGPKSEENVIEEFGPPNQVFYSFLDKKLGKHSKKRIGELLDAQSMLNSVWGIVASQYSNLELIDNFVDLDPVELTQPQLSILETFSGLLDSQIHSLSTSQLHRYQKIEILKNLFISAFRRLNAFLDSST